MHAKILVVDRATALVGSANLTGDALEHNLEAGLLVRGGPAPALIVEHLVRTGLTAPTARLLGLSLHD